SGAQRANYHVQLHIGEARGSGPGPLEIPGTSEQTHEAQMTKLTHKAAGTFAIAPTPFHDDGRIDEKSIDRLTEFYAEIGCDGLTVLGILGEAPKLEGSE